MVLPEESIVVSSRREGRPRERLVEGELLGTGGVGGHSSERERRKCKLELGMGSEAEEGWKAGVSGGSQGGLGHQAKAQGGGRRP